LTTAHDFPIEPIRECSAIERIVKETSSNETEAMLRFYVWLASGCLTTAFIMTQRFAAIRRIESSSNVSTKDVILTTVASKNAFATVGISHLTTSRQHLASAPLRAVPRHHGWELNGYSPWVTGAAWADWIVVGAVETVQATERDATLERDVDSPHREILFAVPRHQAGVQIEPGQPLVALSASATGPVRFECVQLKETDVLHGPVINVMAASGTGGAGGLQTSGLAIGHAAQAIQFLLRESELRSDLSFVAESLHNQYLNLFDELMTASGNGADCNLAELRKSANDLALNSTQAALVAAKGAGFTADHDVGRWCREALFFLVWSCPQVVAQSHLCSFVS